MPRWTLGVLLIALATCSRDASTASVRFRCEVDEACADGYVCRNSVCLRRGTFIDVPTLKPVLQASGAYDAAATAVGRGRSLKVADMNNDRVLDLVMIDDGQVLVLQGTGDGTYGRELGRVGPPEGLDGVGELGFGDFDGDGFLDVAFTQRSSTVGPNVKVFTSRNVGGQLSQPAAHELPTTNPNVKAVLVADFTGDRLDDVLVYIANEPKLFLMPSRGDDTFGRAVATGTLPSGGSASLVRAVDLNDDGHVDLFGSGVSGDSQVEVIFGVGDGTFRNAWRFPLGCSPNGPIHVENFDGDASLELLVNCSGITFQIFRVAPNSASLSVLKTLTLPDNFLSSRNSKISVVADLNGDSRLDIVLSDGSALLMGASDVETILPSQWSLVSDNGVRELATGDVDGNGTADVVMLIENPFVRVAPGTGTGAFTAPRSSRYGRLAVVGASSTQSTTMAAADFNGDGRVDVLSTMVPQHVTLVLQPTAANFVGATETRDVRVDLEATDMLASDFDLDGNADVVVMGAAAIRVLRGRGDGTFALGPLLALSSLGSELVVVDVNEDTFPDVVVPVVSANVVDIFINAGGGALVRFPSVAVGVGPVTVAVGDLTSDSHVDLLVSRRVPAPQGRLQGGLTLAAGDGEGHFATAVELTPPTPTYATSLVVGDLTGDGRLDFARRHGPEQPNGPTVTVYAARGDGTYDGTGLAGFSYTGWPIRREMLLRDTNADGFADLVVATQSLLEVKFGSATGLAGDVVRSSSGGPGSASYGPSQGPVSFDVNGDRLSDWVWLWNNPFGFRFLLARG